MTPLLAFTWASTAFALLPLAMACVNLRSGRGFLRPVGAPPAETSVSILIPARNEEANIEAAVHAALASAEVEIEVVVLDDQSSDRTVERVMAIARCDPRVRLLQAEILPAGWAGKQHACYVLAQAAHYGVLMFVDADVRIGSHAASRAAATLLAKPRLGLVSGFPQEETGSFSEQLVVPWIHVLLVGYLPMDRMRRTRELSLGAGCGQWMVARREAYIGTSGHAAAKSSRHDGLSLPRTFRDRGWDTDLFDGSNLSRCRMYRGWKEVWQGFGKSAGEGMATAGALPVWTVLLLMGHVVPWIALLFSVVTMRADLLVPSVIGVGANLLLRAMLAARVKQPLGTIWAHPVGALVVLAIQSWALVRHWRGQASTWKGRSYVRGSAPMGKTGM